MNGSKPCNLDELVDVALEQSFPASDPPAFMAAAAVVGAPTKPRSLRRAEVLSPPDKARGRSEPVPLRSGPAEPAYPADAVRRSLNNRIS